MSPLLKLNLQVIWIHSKTKVISASEALSFRRQGLGFVSDRTNS